MPLDEKRMKKGFYIYERLHGNIILIFFAIFFRWRIKY